MSDIIDFPCSSPHAAVVRPNGLTNALSELRGENLRTLDDMRRALSMLELANKCVRISLRDFADDPNIRQLARHAEELTSSLEEARFMVQQRGYASPVLAASPARLEVAQPRG